MKPRLVISVLAMALGMVAASNANAILWDLETIRLTSFTLSVSQTVGGVTLTITRPGSNFAIVDRTPTPGLPASWLDRTLSPFTNSGSATPFIGNFSAPVSNVSLEYGDFQPSDVDILIIQAFSGPNGTGALLASITSPPCCSEGPEAFEAHSILLPVANASSISFIGGSAGGPQSLFYDNIQASVVPEPTSLALLGLGLVAFFNTRRRQTS